MKPKLILCLALVLSGGLFGCSTTDSRSGQTASTSSSKTPQPSFKSVQQMFEQNDWKSLEKMYWKTGVKMIEGFNLKQRNAIAVLAAMVFEEAVTSTNSDALMEASGGSSINPDTGLPFDIPRGMAPVSFGMLCALTEDRAITTPDAIPYFIRGLDNQRMGVIQASLFFLVNLTGRASSPNNYIYGDLDFLETNHLAIADWWNSWWRKNKDKHPVFDADLKKILRREILNIDDKIMRASPPDAWPDDGIRSIRGNDWQSNWPKTDLYQSDGNSVFVFWYDNIPGSGTGYIDTARGDNSLRIRGDFLTKNLQFGKNDISSETYPGQDIPAQEILRETVKGTGIEIKVEILTTNIALINILRDKLNK